MRILHIITGLSTGGAELMLLRVAGRLAGRFEQHVISLGDYGSVADRLVESGVPVTALGLRGAVSGPWRLWRLVRLIRRLQPDVVQCWLYHADLVGGIAARLAGVEAVAWNIRNNGVSPDKTKYLTRRVVKLCARFSRRVPKRIVCCAEAAMHAHVDMGYDASRFAIIPNGIDLDRFRPDIQARGEVRRELGVDADTPLLGLIARFDPQKDHEGFFTAAGLLHRVRPDVQFVLAGHGVDESNPKIRGWIAGFSLEKAVHLLGERSDVPRLMSALDMVSSSSWGEAFPNVLGEAMACGVPCVATDAGDAARIVGETGRIVPRGDPQALASAWEYMLSLSSVQRQALGEQARTRVAKHYDIDVIADCYAEFYVELMAERC